MLLSAATCLLLALPGAEASVLRHALIVGANEGGGNLEPLHYAESDAQRMSEVLVELGGFDPAYVTVLYAPTAEDLKAALHEHAQYAANFDDDLFLFYYSGHADAKGLRLGSGLYPFDALKTDVRAMPAEVKLGILDACRSGTITRLKGASVSASFLPGTSDDGSGGLAAEGEAWMTATSAEESAQESDLLRGSFFTHYLISGLRGAADEGGDGQISLDEAYRYAFDRVVDRTGETTNGVQHPNFDFRLKGQGDLALTRVSAARASLLIPAELSGSLLVLRLPDRTPVAEVAKQAGVPVTLALPPGTYRLRLTRDSSIQESTVGLNEGGRATANQWGAVNAQASAAKGPKAVALDAAELSRMAGREGSALLLYAINPLDLRHSPLLAGTSSAVLPGAGQFYNGQWGTGLLYLGTFSLLTGTALATNPSAEIHGMMAGQDMLRLSALMVYGASIADASWHARRDRDTRPHRGFALSTNGAWTVGESWSSPSIAGISLDVPATRGVSVGADRIGWTFVPGTESGGQGGTQIIGVGTRAAFYVDAPRLVPGVFLAVGLRAYVPEDQDVSQSLLDLESSSGAVLDASVPPSTRITPVVGTGASLRWYISPAYFVQWEARLESDGGPLNFQVGGGVGIHLGK